ncbi:zinc finger BED domain-containing protein 4-like [Rhinophrynus dorsalis]
MGFVVTDGAANMIKALRDGRFVCVRCSAHVLHLVVKAALEDGSNTGKLSALLESCRQIAGHFHQTVKDSQLLREEQEKAGPPEHRLKQDVGTRWNSTLNMLERILEQKKAICAMSCHHFIGSNRTLGRADWALMEQVVTVLTPFRASMEILSKENASLAEAIPLFTHLSLKLDNFLAHKERLSGADGNILPDVAALLTRLKKELTRCMEERMDGCPELMLATMCDPRVKGKMALTSNSFTAWREQSIARWKRDEVKDDIIPTPDPKDICQMVEVRDKIWRKEFVEIFSLLPLDEAPPEKEEKDVAKKEEKERHRYRRILKVFGN